MRSLGNVVTRIRISTLGTGLTVAGVTIAAALVLSSTVAVRNVQRVGQSWTDYNTGPAVKAVHLRHLQGAIGYGGVVHDFKNYILRRDRPRLVRIQMKIRDVIVYATAYRSLGVSERESEALDQVERVIGEYYEMVVTAERMVAEGATAREIDDVIMIDDEAALAALSVLDEELARAREASSQSVGGSVAAAQTLVTWSSRIGATVLFLLTVCTLWFTRIHLARPFAELIDIVNRLAGGDVSVEITGRGRGDEIGDMMRAVEVFKTNSVALVERTHSLAEAQRLAHLGSWIGNPVEGTVEWSDEIYRLHGLEPGEVEVTPETILERIHPEDIDRVEKTVREVMASGEPFTIEFRVVHDDGTVRTLRCQGEFVHEGGEIVRGFGTLQDITEQEESRAQIEASLREKEILLKEVHHRVKNNLQVISSLLILQADTTKEPGVKDGLQKTQRRIMAMAGVHETLYGHESLSHLDCLPYLRSLTQDLLALHEANVEIDLDVSGYLPIDQAVPMGLIVSELVSNALEHAFPTRSPGAISVALGSKQEGVVLRVSDDGIGLPSQDDIREGNTLGWKLVSVLAEQLGGTLSVERDGGTRVEITFPVHTKTPM